MIRKACNLDIDQINKLGKLLYNNFSTTYNIKDYLNNDKYIILVNEEDIINGVLIIFKNIDYYELEIIVVDLNKRKKGIGTNLLTYFINNFCHKNDIIFLEVSEKNNIAIQLYKKIDFKIINERKKYYQDANAIIMKKVCK